ncbi:MAG: transketolase [Dehalococcoidales bacterium]|nr:transketolase [Dehalococcoidales bacterium]
MAEEPIDKLCINTIRFLAVDAIEKAKSGHPGMPMGAAPMAYVLWDRFLKHSPGDPKWPDRDRFVLSAGHGSMLLYALLFLTGYNLTLNDIKLFRQWGSRTPGHPEYGLVPGAEATTGPLGQGFANGVGMAIAERWLAQHYNRPEHEIINHHTYAIASDGDIQEGISSEAASLAGTLKLGKLIYLYDDNGISIEGKTSIAFAENVPQRFQAYGWQVIGPIDGMNLSAVDSAIRKAQAETHRPSLIVCRTVIGYGSPNKGGTAATHGEPLGEEETRLAKENLKWHYQEPFTVPPEVLAHMRWAEERGSQWQRQWQARLEAYRKAYPREAEQLEKDLRGDLPNGWDYELNTLFRESNKPIATRSASGQVMNAIAQRVHSFAGGSADLAPSTKTTLTERFDGLEADYNHNMHFGIREHAMGAIANGMALHGGIIPYTGTFLVFYDYMRPPVRLAALMGIRVIFIFSHDSVGLGEDGPTHQPIEQLMGLRTVPDLVTIRPADATETVEAWKVAMENRDGPTALVFSRQDMPVLDRSTLAPASGLRRGGYILWQASPAPDIIIIGTGSEVHIALEAGKLLQDKGIKARVVSLPSWELFDAQPREYQDEVLPPKVRTRISIEAASSIGWEHYVGLDGVAIGISRFGASAPGKVIYERLGLTAQRLVIEALQLLAERKT